MNMRYVLTVIDKMRDEWWYKPPTDYYGQRRINFDYQSYIYSAMNEIKFYLMEHDDQNPISVMEDFRHLVDCFACDAKTAEQNFMFSVYYDVASDVLDMLLLRKKNE